MSSSGKEFEPEEKLIPVPEDEEYVALVRITQKRTGRKDYIAEIIDLSEVELDELKDYLEGFGVRTVVKKWSGGAALLAMAQNWQRAGFLD